jgi:hypothetical protein
VLKTPVSLTPSSEWFLYKLVFVVVDAVPSPRSRSVEKRRGRQLTLLGSLPADAGRPPALQLGKKLTEKGITSKNYAQSGS